jgi:hypothetical protein
MIHGCMGRINLDEIIKKNQGVMIYKCMYIVLKKLG